MDTLQIIRDHCITWTHSNT